MGYVERITWSQLVASTVGMVVYLVIVIPQMRQTSVDGIEWVWPMVWTIVGSVALSILLSILWGIFAGMRDPNIEYKADQRDREIEHFGDRVGQAFLVIGSLAALMLAMVSAHWFWIGNALFFGFYLSALLGGIARLVAYRRGFQ